MIGRITAETVIRNVIIASSFLPEGNFPGLLITGRGLALGPQTVPIANSDPFENLTSYEWGEGRKNRTENCFGLACQEYPLAPAMLTRVRQLTAPLRSRLCNWL